MGKVIRTKRDVTECVGMNGAAQIQIVKKLDKIERQIEEMMKVVEGLELETSYPPESRIRKSYAKKLAKIDREMKAGKYHTYKSVEEFERAVSRAS